MFDKPNRPAATRSGHRETISYDDRETKHRGILGGSAHPWCRGQARGPAPTVSSLCDATSPIVHVVANVSSSHDATSRDVNVVARTITLSDVVHRIKSLTTTHYRHAVINHGCPPFPGRLWQRNYYERIIRDERALANIRRYIRANPRNWIEPPRWR